MNSKTFSAVLGLAALLAPAASAAKHEIRWVLAHEPSGVFAEAAAQFAELVGKETNGDVSVRIISSKEFGGGKPVNPNKVAELVASGKVEMTQTYTTSLGRHSKKLMVLDIPFLFRDHEHAAKVLDGEIGKELLASLEPRRMKGLAFTYSGGYRILPTKDREIHKPSDLKGLRVRTSGSPVAMATLKALGATPVPASLYELSDLAKSGKIDATESTLPRWADDHNEAVVPVINETNHSLFLTAVMVNGKFFASLPKAHQDAVERAAITMAKLERRRSIEAGQEVKRAALAGRGKFVMLTPEEQAQFVAALRPVRDEFAPRFHGLVERIENTR